LSDYTYIIQYNVLKIDLSSEELMEATVAESAMVRWWCVFAVGRKVHVSTLAFQCSSQYEKWDGMYEKCGKRESYLGS